LKKTMTSTSENNVHVKLQFNDEYRRFFFHRSSKFAELLEKVKAILNLKEDFVVKYKDEEGEWITISSDMELETGLILANGALFRLQISLCSTPLELKKDCSVERNDDCGDKPWKKFKKERRCRKWRDSKDGDEDEECGGGRKKWKKFRKQGRMRKRWDHHDDDENGSSSEDNGDSLLSLDEIKKKIEQLKLELEALKDKIGASKAEMREVRTKIWDRRNTTPTDVDGMVELKKTLKEKKEKFWTILKELKNRRMRIKRLRDLAQTKNV